MYLEGLLFAHIERRVVCFLSLWTPWLWFGLSFFTLQHVDAFARSSGSLELSISQIAGMEIDIFEIHCTEHGLALLAFKLVSILYSLIMTQMPAGLHRGDFLAGWNGYILLAV